jgi:hypothetical protein
VLAPVTASDPTVLIAEQGAIGVRAYGAGLVGHGIDVTQADTVLRRGEHLVVGPGTIRTVRNAGPSPAVVLVVAIEAAAVPPPSLSTIAPEPCRPGFC